VRLGELLDVSVLEKLAGANYLATGMPFGIVDAVDGSVLVGFGWQDVCTMYHRVNPITAERCRESDTFIKDHLDESSPCEYTCKNGLRDIGIPIRVAGEHLATLFLGQFFYEGESPDREYFIRQARDLGFDVAPYLAALARVPVFPRATVENTLRYNAALARIIAELAEGSLRRRQAEASLDRERTLLASIMHATDVMLVYLDRDFNFVWVNAAYAGTCDMRPDELVGKNHFALYPHADNEAIFRRVRDTGEAVFFKDKSFEFPDQPQRGVTYWDWSLVPVKEPSGKVQGLVFSLRETTKFKRAELELDEERMRWRGVVEGIADERHRPRR
jgi:PAS domain S-box-containing protein